MGLLLGLLMASFMSLSPGAAMFGGLMIVVLPIMYGIFGFIGGAISAVLYNLVADRFGGLEIDLK
jgi:hypothetical protein